MHDVLRRNDIQLTRDVFYFSGYAFNKRLDYNILVFTSSATLVATAAGYAGFVFSKAFALRAGYFSLPSVRSLTGTYPFFHGIDRSMATNYFRPGFTQGVWANGEPLPGINYIAMIGNALNTLDIKASSLDQNRFAGALSVWYDRNDFDKYWNDYEHHESPALRIGTAFTFAREDRLSDLDGDHTRKQRDLHLGRPVAVRRPGRSRPVVTISFANYYLWAIDAGLKYRGFAINGELYLRWLNNFVTDGPLPMNSMFDWGYDFSAGYFVVPQRGAVRPVLADPRTVRDRRRGLGRLHLVPVRHAAGLAQRRGHRRPRLSLLQRLLLLLGGADRRGLPRPVPVALLIDVPTARRADRSRGRSPDWPRRRADRR